MDKRDPTLLDLGDSALCDVMMLYQVLKENAACRGRIAVSLPHPDAPLSVMAEFVARRPVRWRGVHVQAGQMATFTLTYRLDSAASRRPSPPIEPLMDEAAVVAAILDAGATPKAALILRAYGDHRVALTGQTS